MMWLGTTICSSGHQIQSILSTKKDAMIGNECQRSLSCEHTCYIDFQNIYLISELDRLAILTQHQNERSFVEIARRDIREADVDERHLASSVLCRSKGGRMQCSVYSPCWLYGEGGVIALLFGCGNM